MTIDDEIQKLEGELNNEVKDDENVADEATKPDDEVVENAEEKTDKEETAATTEKPPVKEDEEPKKGSAYARMRRENRMLAERLAAIEADKERERKEEEERKKAIEDPEPNKDDNYEGWLEWRDRQLEKTVLTVSQQLEELRAWKQNQEAETEQKTIYSAAVEEFSGYERQFASKVPDYKDAAQHARAILKTSIAVLYPDATPEQLERATNAKVLEFASNAVKNGLNPAEEVYKIAKSRFGYVQRQEEDKQDQKGKPNLKVIERNKKRSASALNAGGQGSSSGVSLETMSFTEFNRLTPAQLEELERSA